MIRLMQAVQSAGPYRLAGWSFGGLLAYEVAQQLRSAGQAVEFLALIDTFTPQDEVFEPGASLGQPSSFEYLTAEEVIEQSRLLELHVRAMSRYRPASSVTPVDLFVAGERPADVTLSVALGWERYIDPAQLRVRSVPGTHESMMKPPNVRVLGDAISQALAR